MVAGTSCDPGATLLSYPMTGTEDIHNYIVNAEVRRIGMEGDGMMAGAAPRAREDGLPVATTRGYSMMNGSGAANHVTVRNHVTASQVAPPAERFPMTSRRHR